MSTIEGGGLVVKLPLAHAPSGSCLHSRLLTRPRTWLASGLETAFESTACRHGTSPLILPSRSSSAPRPSPEPKDVLMQDVSSPGLHHMSLKIVRGAQVLKNETFKAEVIGRTPMRRVGHVSEVAATVANLAMPGAS